MFSSLHTRQDERRVIRLDDSFFEKPDPLPGKWQIACDSVRGSSHEKSGLPNQDAFDWCLISQDGPTLAAAVSDGHGNPRCFRSDIGSRYAVKAALTVLQEAAGNLTGLGDPSLIKQEAETRLAEQIANGYRVTKLSASNDSEKQSETDSTLR
jgi:serine/threonine protein phosphatase PrpC